MSFRNFLRQAVPVILVAVGIAWALFDGLRIVLGFVGLTSVALMVYAFGEKRN